MSSEGLSSNSSEDPRALQVRRSQHLRRQRLLLHSPLWDTAAEDLMGQILVRRGWRCLDLGCGARGVLRPLSQAMAGTGTILGVEDDATQLDVARHWLQREPLDGVELLEADPYSVRLPRKSFDLAHARFLFCCHDRENRLLAELIAVTKPGGVVAIEEPDATTWGCSPDRPGFVALAHAVQKAVRRSGADLNVGRRLLGMLRIAGLRDVWVRAHVLELPADEAYRRVLVQLASALRERIIEEEILAAAQLDEAIADAEAAASDPGCAITSFTLVQAWGRTQV